MQDHIETRHRDGVPWHKAPLPKRLHRCVWQTKGWVGLLTYVERCACGAIRLDSEGPWMERNSRRKSQRRWWRR